MFCDKQKKYAIAAMLPACTLITFESHEFCQDAHAVPMCILFTAVLQLQCVFLPVMLTSHFQFMNPVRG